MRATKFTIDSLDGYVFDGYTDGEEWNGFACPYFTYNQAEKVLEAYLATGRKAWYDADADRFVFEVDGKDEVDSFNAVELVGEKFYPVGAFCWIWDEAEAASQV